MANVAGLARAGCILNSRFGASHGFIAQKLWLAPKRLNPEVWAPQHKTSQNTSAKTTILRVAAKADRTHVVDRWRIARMPGDNFDDLFADRLWGFALGLFQFVDQVSGC